ncbi:MULTISPECIES: thiamine diphosphokinase [Halanaerobium]|jgi:thiamine pyrophosphokinase|uniref:Thiamine diphosphokinase n=1 Tax=Halanaerobium saccharolyticum TaxID=43595 RepID=A0A4R6S654_9FIRM|nr:MULTISPECIES: thiamine diphosphokinase [Halanaerobium]PUU94119.1 MAG: thiamine pyrophosphokinase [Halanaerobium sp.]PUU94331.1 MAG: thiamine pyrophosphokinase [Halanaerobium sp.]TDP95240.1 thiamine diphosphokinase [Halanaerobium saccharolyticum]
MSKKKALLVLNGEFDLNKKKLELIIKKEGIDFIIAVDGGSNKLKKLELLPDLIIGDLDSITEENKNHFRKEKVEIIKHPVEKDQTDSEIAVDYCKENDFEQLYLTAALGGRIDQQLANLNLLEYIYEIDLEAKIISDKIEIAIIDQKKKFLAKEGYRLSLIPQSSTVRGLSIKGCKYNLTNQDIFRSQSRGISNLIESEQAEVRLKSGLLIYVLEKLK